MGRIFQPLLFMLARCTWNELIRHIEFLQAENEILRSRLKKHHLQLRPAERARLLELRSNADVGGSSRAHSKDRRRDRLGLSPHFGRASQTGMTKISPQTVSMFSKKRGMKAALALRGHSRVSGNSG